MDRKKRIVISAALGGGLELFDFVIYLFLSPVITLIFFPHQDKSLAFLATLGGFAAGYLARPLGGIVYGHFGDKNGRMRALSFSLFFMAIPTLLISMLPTYATLGILAPILLILLRFAQGLAMGGDVPGAICFIGEHMPIKQRGFMTCWLIFGMNMGAVTASFLVAALISLLTNESMLTWGWRIPFLMGALLAVVGFYIRRRTLETPKFEQSQKKNELVRWPLKKLFLDHRRSVIFGFSAAMLYAVVTSILSLFMSSYLSQYIGIPSGVALWLNSASISAYSISCIGAGLLVDRFSPLRILKVGTALMFFAVYPIFMLIGSHNLLEIIIALLFSAPILALIVSPVPTMLIELFPTPVRYSGIGVCYSLGLGLFAGISPLLVAFLIAQTGLKIIPAFYIMFISLLTFILFSLTPLRSSFLIRKPH